MVAFTHLWNPIGYPTIHPDEGYYIGRSIHVSEGLGPKEEAARYDHPYFGWLFLGSIFSVINYPDSTNPTPGNVNSIELIWLFPRVTMGILAVVDTFLIYKIAERRYSRNVAFIAAILFAVMPYTWLIRRVLIEPIQLPFLLTSILFALYTGIRARQKEPKEVVMVKSREDGGGSSEKIGEKEKERQGRIVEQVQLKVTTIITTAAYEYVVPEYHIASVFRNFSGINHIYQSASHHLNTACRLYCIYK